MQFPTPYGDLKFSTNNAAKFYQIIKKFPTPYGDLKFSTQGCKALWAISSNSIFRLSNKITLYLRVSKQNISLCSKKSPLQPQIFQAIMSISQNGVSQRSNTALHHIPQILRFCQYYQKVKHLCMYVIFYKYSANPACVKKCYYIFYWVQLTESKILIVRYNLYIFC